MGMTNTLTGAERLKALQARVSMARRIPKTRAELIFALVEIRAKVDFKRNNIFEQTTTVDLTVGDIGWINHTISHLKEEDDRLPTLTVTSIVMFALSLVVLATTVLLIFPEVRG